MAGGTEEIQDDIPAEAEPTSIEDIGEDRTRMEIPMQDVETESEKSNSQLLYKKLSEDEKRKALSVWTAEVEDVEEILRCEKEKAKIKEDETRAVDKSGNEGHECTGNESRGNE